MLALTLLVAGCGKKEEQKTAQPPPTGTAQAPQPAPAAPQPPQPASPAPQTPSPAPQTTAPTPAPAPEATATAPRPAQTPDAAPAPAAAPASNGPSAKVLAATDGEKPGLRVEVQELKRVGGTVTLRFTMINDSGENFDTHALRGDVTKTWRNVGGVHLVDNINKKKYLVIMDAEKKCVCSSDIEPLKPKSRMSAWARFPAPPDDVKKITVIVPHFIPMDDVPISG
jgi:hypothetical protein